MRELRLSIPIIGGVTAIYTRDEVAAKVAKAKYVTRRAIVGVLRLSSKAIGKLGDCIEPKIINK